VLNTSSLLVAAAGHLKAAVVLVATEQLPGLL
jgi:hypothetical protein